MDQHIPSDWEAEFQRLLTDLEHLETVTTDPVKRTEEAIVLCLRAKERLKSSTGKLKFKSIQEEIRYFKEVQPKYRARLLFYVHLRLIYVNKPTWFGQDEIANYFRLYLKEIYRFQRRHQEFYHYYRTGASYQDELFFKRRAAEDWLPLTLTIDVDHENTTPVSVLFAQMMANDLLTERLVSDMRREPLDADKTKAPSMPPLRWTDSKVGATELIYALKAKGAFNNGNASLSDIFSYWQQVFGVEISNGPRTFQEILSRQKGPNVYLQELMQSSKKYRDEMDE